MKKVLTLLSFVCLLANFASAQAVTVVELKDSISKDTRLTADKIYFLKGFVYVTSGTTVTIEAGTLIKGDKDTKGTLIFERGSKIIAQGTAKKPIVMTSNQPQGQRSYGDWGGLVLCGKSPTNWNGGVSQVEGGPRSLYGGTDAADNSGILQYVRIEFAGIALSPNNEINGLTLCSVGSGTVIDHICVSYSGDDSIEWFGGTVNCKYLVAHRGWDDDFDMDNGYSGNLQYLFGIRDPFAADQSGSKGFEIDSYQSGTATGLTAATRFLTQPTISNATVIGPLIANTSSAWDPQFVSGAHFRRGCAASLHNSLIVGYPVGVLFDESSSAFGSTIANYVDTSVAQIRNVGVAGTQLISGVPQKNAFYVKDGARSLTPTITSGDSTTAGFGAFNGPVTYMRTPAFLNKEYATAQQLRLYSAFNLDNPNPVPLSTSPVAYKADTSKVKAFNPTKPLNFDTTGGKNSTYNAPDFWPSFDASRLLNGFFDKVNFVGAFSGTGTNSDNWTNGWCNFTPTTTDYSKPLFLAVNEATEVNLSLMVYPNPLKNNGRIEFDLPQDAQTRVILTDLSGRVLSTVVNARLTAGNYVEKIDINNLDNGIYLLSVRTEFGSQTRKFSIIK